MPEATAVPSDRVYRDFDDMCGYRIRDLVVEITGSRAAYDNIWDRYHREVKGAFLAPPETLRKVSALLEQTLCNLKQLSLRLQSGDPGNAETIKRVTASVVPSILEYHLRSVIEWNGEQ